MPSSLDRAGEEEEEVLVVVGIVISQLSSVKPNRLKLSNTDGIFPFWLSVPIPKYSVGYAA